MAELKWRVVLVAEQHPGVVIKTELVCIERDADVGVGSVKNVGRFAASWIAG